MCLFLFLEIRCRMCLQVNGFDSATDCYELDVHPCAPQDRAICSNSAENFKRPKNREDSSDLDENLTESIAAQKTFI